MAESCGFLVRETLGIYGLKGPPDFGPLHTLRLNEDGDGPTPETRFSLTSPDKSIIAIGTDTQIRVFNTHNGHLLCSCPIEHRILNAKFSPQGSYMSIWNDPKACEKNFNIWDTRKGSVVHSAKLIKLTDAEYSSDEKIYARLVNNSVLFFDAPTDFLTPAHKTPAELKIASFSLTTTAAGDLYVLCFTKGTTGPSCTRLYKYPDFGTAVATKSFFQASKVTMKWNSAGDAVLLLTAAEIDRTRTGEPMYGNQMLHFMNVRGHTAAVQTGTEANAIHAAEWSPTSTEFCILTGSMPNIRAALLNLKCEKIFDMTISSARNVITFNPQGNLLLLSTFGLRETVQVWEVKVHRKLLVEVQAPDTTQTHWLNDGVHFITATVSPQMVMRNGFKVWDLKGNCVKEWKAEKQLLLIVPFLSVPPKPFPQDKLDAIVKLQLGSKSKSLPQGPTTHSNPSNASGDPNALSEKEKKIRTLKKKIGEIEKLKEMERGGKELEKNQRDKLTKEKELLADLKSLQIS